MIQQDPIPHLQGSVCTGLIREEAWYKGERHEDAGIIFLQVNDKQWHRIFIDAGVLFWKEVAEPDEWTTSPSDEFHFPQVELTALHNLHGRTIKAIIPGEESMTTDLQIWLSGGITLVLGDENDRSTLSVVTASHSAF